MSQNNLIDFTPAEWSMAFLTLYQEWAEIEAVIDQYNVPKDNESGERIPLPKRLEILLNDKIE